MDPWELIRSRQYEAAVSAYTRQFEEHGGKPNLNNRGIANLLMGQYDAALEDFRRSAQLDSRYASTTEFAFAGVCSWYLARPNETVAAWRAGLAAPYADAAGGVELPALLLYAGCRLADVGLQTESRALLKKLWRNHRRRIQRRNARSASPTHADLVHPGLVAWPGAIVPFLLGEIGTDELISAAGRAGSDILRQRWECGAHFYVAVRAACANDSPTFLSNMFKSAGSDRAELEPEWHLARWEVERGNLRPVNA